MIDERKDLKRYLAERKEDVTEEALQLMEDLVTHLLKKQKDFTEKFEALHESKVKVITDQIKRCSMIQKETSTSMRQLTVIISRMITISLIFTHCFIKGKFSRRRNRGELISTFLERKQLR